jgi:hypothetical protein
MTKNGIKQYAVSLYVRKIKEQNVWPSSTAIQIAHISRNCSPSDKTLELSLVPLGGSCPRGINEAFWLIIIIIIIILFISGSHKL